MSKLQAAVDAVGGQAALAGRIGVRQQHVWNWLHRGDAVGAENCVAIERATAGAVRRWDLRPTDWHRIWPELIGTEGAPPTTADHHTEGTRDAA